MDVILQPDVLRWARERAGLSVESLARKFSPREAEKWEIKVRRWEADGNLTFKQAEKLAEKTYTPFGYLYLDNPPVEQLPISDFRTLASDPVKKPSPDLIDVIDAAIIRQRWFSDYAAANGDGKVDFIGVLTGEEEISPTARRICDYFGLETAIRANARNYEEALVVQRECLEKHGVLVMQSGIVGENTHRPLKVDEFRGFALTDEYAPLIFINSKDVLAARIFTLMHELVHLWLGVSGVSNLNNTYAPDRKTEVFCNAVAAEILVPASELKHELSEGLNKGDIKYLARHFKVSQLVIIRRLRDLSVISQTDFNVWYREAQKGYQSKVEYNSPGGGNYYNTKMSRLGKRFLSAVVENTLEGRIAYKEAFHLLGVGKVQTFRTLARELDFQP